uniref:Predicted protein n=1 Tax=Hordeum vulgare subsp. vulgare TaxID=112509 RepID=F2D5R8_HORVV|nr:predicted protein [Hordeum vulgare subsp. vulgare]
MADDPNQNFGQFSQPFCSQNVVSFQTSVMPSGSGGSMPVYLDCSSSMESNMGMMNTTPSIAVSTSSSNMVADSAQNLKYGGPLAETWSRLELEVLKDCLDRYVNEHGIMKYIKIAASLPTKTVRDVAMRCQWMGVSNLKFAYIVCVFFSCLSGYMDTISLRCSLEVPHH